MKKISSRQILLLTLLLLTLLASCAYDDIIDNADNTDTRSVDQSVKIKTDILYGQAINVNDTLEDLKLDLYLPPGYKTSKKYPLVLMVHGGAYAMGDKGDMKGDCIILADSGYIAASINYRMGWDQGVGDCDGDLDSKNEAAYRALQDANAALRFLTARSTNLNVDTTWIFIGGSSAGSSIALNTSYITNAVAKVAYPDIYASLGPVNTSGNPLRNKFKIKAICNMWGAVPDSTLINGNNALPTIAFHGTADTVVPYNIGHSNSCDNYPIIYGSLCIHRQLLRYDKPTITNLVIGGGHGPAVYHHDFLMGNTACFFRRLIKGIPIESRVDTSLISSCN
jgi:acetyl esterase/lipase